MQTARWKMQFLKSLKSPKQERIYMIFLKSNRYNKSWGFYTKAQSACVCEYFCVSSKYYEKF